MAADLDAAATWVQVFAGLGMALCLGVIGVVIGVGIAETLLRRERRGRG
jgi:hypothetical protein